jgi:N-acetylmuramoyl-L-alanine amidase
MKSAAPLVLRPLLIALLTAAGAAPAHSAPGKSDQVQLSGRPYVRLGGWARANEFALRWLDRDRTLELSNRLARLVFNVDPRLDSRRTRINGVEVWLAFPILCRNGSVFISQLDLEATLAPVLSPPSNPSGLKLKTICLDPGHGGNDPGFILGANEEKQHTLLLAKEVRDQLTRLGFNVVLTRSSDARVPLETRPELARKRGADLFLSLHFNSAGPQHKEVDGVETYCLTPERAFSTNAGGEGDTRGCAGNRHNEKNMLLAYQLQKAIARGLPVEDRGVKRARYEVLREATMPAALIEAGFMSNPAESRRIFDPTYRRQMARAIVDGILAYKRLVKG